MADNHHEGMGNESRDSAHKRQIDHVTYGCISSWLTKIQLVPSVLNLAIRRPSQFTNPLAMVAPFNLLLMGGLSDLTSGIFHRMDGLIDVV